MHGQGAQCFKLETLMQGSTPVQALEQLEGCRWRTGSTPPNQTKGPTGQGESRSLRQQQQEQDNGVPEEEKAAAMEERQCSARAGRFSEDAPQEEDDQEEERAEEQAHRTWAEFRGPGRANQVQKEEQTERTKRRERKMWMGATTEKRRQQKTEEKAFR